MTKWLVISLITLLGFMVMLLGLGYLLSENEKATTLLKKELAQEAQLAQKKSAQSQHFNDYTKVITTADDESTTASQRNAQVNKAFEQTLLNNLTCVTVAQCQLVTIKFNNIDCQLASNVIGAAQLKKIATQTISIDTCPIVAAESELACQQNICTLISPGQ